MIINMTSGGVMPDRILDAQTITPGTKDQIIEEGTYLRGPLTILGDADLIPENIKENEEIFGKVGTLVQGMTAQDFGCEKIAIDKITFSTRTSMKTVLNHSLNGIPKAAFILCSSNAMNMGKLFRISTVFNTAGKGSLAIIACAATGEVTGVADGQVTATASTIDFTQVSSLGYMYDAGVEHTLITVA